MALLGIFAALVLLWLLFRGIWDLSFEPPQVLPENPIRLKCAVGGFVEVVGECYHEANIRRARRSAEPREHFHLFWAGLEHEPNNRADPNAVKVHFNGLTLGYLSRSDARTFLKAHRAALGSGRPIVCEARILGGTREKPNLGVFLDFWLEVEERQPIGLDEQGHGRRGA